MEMKCRGETDAEMRMFQSNAIASMGARFPSFECSLVREAEKPRSIVEDGRRKWKNGFANGTRRHIRHHRRARRFDVRN